MHNSVDVAPCQLPECCPHICSFRDTSYRGVESGLCHAAERDFSEELLLVFLGLIVACLACAQRSARSGDRVRSGCSAATGIYYLVAFAGIASGTGNPMINIAFTIAVARGWAWLTALCVRALGAKA